MQYYHDKHLQFTRRQLLTGSTGTFGLAALASLLGDNRGIRLRSGCFF
jgi:hypothetical protein